MFACRYNGVSRSPSRSPLTNEVAYRSRVFIKGKEICLGHYGSQFEAAQAFDKAVLCSGVRCMPTASRLMNGRPSLRA